MVNTVGREAPRADGARGGTSTRTSNTSCCCCRCCFSSCCCLCALSEQPVTERERERGVEEEQLLFVSFLAVWAPPRRCCGGSPLSPSFGVGLAAASQRREAGPHSALSLSLRSSSPPPTSLSPLSPLSGLMNASPSLLSSLHPPVYYLNKAEEEHAPVT